MHAAITAGDALLMGSDDPTAHGSSPVQGMKVTYSTDDPGEAKRVFDALAEGGTVEAPVGETFFSPMFGMCTDRFGTPWMVNTQAPEQ